MKLLAYSDLEARGIIPNRTQLKRAQDEYGFPPGRMITPNTRRWTEDEVIAWVESRPVGGRPDRRGRTPSVKLAEAV